MTASMLERESVETRYRTLTERIRSAAEDVGRDPGDITLVAVTKGFDVSAIRLADELGLGAIGENRVKNALEKKESVPDGLANRLEWHMIGHVQSNKVRYLLGEFDLIHSVDRSSLFEELDKRLSREDLNQRVLMQVNTSGEDSKHGVDPEEAPALLESLLESDVLTVSGLMTMAPFTDDETILRGTFARCRTLREDLENKFDLALSELSMGMTNDFEQAIKEGSTMLRIGRGIFGERPD